jgi:cobalt-zinc-cadmium efflux system outer membrane protein
LAVPDLSLSLSYDQQGSYVNNFTSLGVAMDLPFFNRNQGNIKSAKITMDMNNAAQKATEATVEENVYHALQKAFAQDKMLQSIDPHFASDFDRLMHEVLINYQKRNIGLLDFLDFYDSYKQNILQLNSIQYNRVSAFEDLNFYTGTSLF